MIYFDNKRPIDVICMGRVAVDLYAKDIGVNLADVNSFNKYLGGCAGNIAVGTARLGLKSSIFSCVGQDDMGEFIAKELLRCGVNRDFLFTTDKHLTGLVLLGIKPPREFPLIFYRNDCADMQIKAEQITKDGLKQAKSLLITGTGLSTAEMLQTTKDVVQMARQCETAVIMDLDFRPVLWGLTTLGNGESRYITDAKVSKTYQELVPLCDLIVGTEEEFCIAGGSTNFDEALSLIQAQTTVPLVVKLGEKGCTIYLSHDKKPLSTRSFPVDVLNVLGAGDAFMSGLLLGLLNEQGWDKAATYANAAGALVVTRHGCAPAIPNLEELHYFIDNYQLEDKIWLSPKLEYLHAKSVTQDEHKSLIKSPLGFDMGLNPIVSMNHGMGMKFSSLRLAKGETYIFQGQYEMAALVLSGKVLVEYGLEKRMVERYDYFSQNPYVLHTPAGFKSVVHAHSYCEILLIETENNTDFTPLLFDEHSLVEVDPRGQGLLEDTSYRLVRTVFDKRNRPESNLVVGEIITFQGRWSSYPSHYHDQPEVYHYRFSEPQGYGFGEKGKEVLRIEHYDTYCIPQGMEHAHTTAPGYALYTLWFIKHLANNPYIQPTFRKEHEWTRTAWSNQRTWKL